MSWLLHNNNEPVLSLTGHILLAPLGCRRPPPLTDGDIKDSVRFQYRHEDRVEYVCPNFYIMQGGPYKTCKNGEWVGQMRCLSKFPFPTAFCEDFA